jgi:2-ketoarginine methyltransferase
LGIRHVFKVKKLHEDMLRYARGYMVSQCMSGLLNLGFFQMLSDDKKIDIDLYAAENNLDKKILKSVCEYLYSLRILKKYEDAYMLDSEGKRLSDLSQGVFDFLYAYAPLFHDLGPLLKKEKTYGRDIFRREKFVAKGSAGITRYLPFPMAEDIIKTYGFRRILDLGCGSGEFLISLCEKNDDIKCYGVDISGEAIFFAREKVSEAGKGDKINLSVNSIFELDEIAKKWDDVEVLVSMFVLHEFLFEGKERVITLLRRLKKNFPGRYLIVCELCKEPLESLRKRPTAIAEHHLFHALSNQGVITFEEWKDIFREAGYGLAETRKFDFAGQAYFVVR